jgi:hypothetical protein
MTYRFVPVLPILVLIVSLAACSTVSKSMHWMSYGPPMNESELNSMISSGTRMKLNWANGGTGIITYYSDGKAIVEKAGNSTTGNWEIKDDELCMNWSPGDESGGQCYSVYHDEGKVLKLFDEQGTHYADTIPGLSS